MANEEKKPRKNLEWLDKEIDTAAQQRRERRANRGRNRTADWGGVDPGCLLDAVQKVTKHGYAIRFGYTRDGGAYAVGIIGDGDPFTEYCRATEDVDLFLRSIADEYAG
jgi:hypothetical protein